MNHVRSLAEVLSFSPGNYEYTLSLGETDIEQLVDVYLTIHGKPTLLNHGGLLLTGCNDVRIYAENIDITISFIEEIRSLLDAKDQDEFKQEYQAALASWIDLEKKMGGAYLTQDLEGEKAKAIELAAKIPLSANLDKLGSSTGGFSGNLHLFNFLYNAVRIPAVSLSKVITRHLTSGGTLIDRKDIRSITVSCGPCRLFDPSWNPTTHLPRGTVYILMEPIYHDLLEDRVSNIEYQITQLQTMLIDRLKHIDEILGTSGPIQRAIGNLNRTTIAHTQEIERCKLELKSNDDLLNTASASVRELKQSVDNLE